MRNRLAVILGIVTAVLTVTVVAQTDVTGEWTMTIDTEQGLLPATMMLQQDGEKLTGTLVSDQGTLEFEGTIPGIEHVVGIGDDDEFKAGVGQQGAVE